MFIALEAATAQTMFVVDLLVVLVTAATVAIVLQRVRLAIIPAYLIAGVMVGPNSFALVRSVTSLEAIAQLAIVLLMFGVGLHLNLNILGRNIPRKVAAGAISCLLSILMGWPIAMQIGLSAPAGLAVCMALSMSSTAVVLRLIADRGELRHSTGQIALAILVVQDLMVLLMFAALPAIARWAGVGVELLPQDAADALPTGGRIIADSSIRIGCIAALIVFGKVVLPRLLSEAAREKSGEVLTIVAIAVAISAGVATQALGFSMELGAFMAGFLLSGTVFRHLLSAQIAPLRDVFLAVFFTTLGMRLDPLIVIESWWIILTAGILMSFIKAIAIGFTCWSLGTTAVSAVAVGMALAQGGEFSLVLLGVIRDQQIISDTVAANATAIVVLSLIFTPAMIDLGRRFSRRWCGFKAAPWIRHAIDHAHPSEPVPAAPVHKHVILAGYGQVGSRIGETLKKANVPYTVIETDPDTARRGSQAGCSIVFGNAAHPDVLESAGIDHADALILTIPNEHVVLEACAIAKRRNSRIFIVARMVVARYTRAAAELGVDYIIIEELETARAMEQAVMKHFARSAPTTSMTELLSTK